MSVPAANALSPAPLQHQHLDRAVVVRLVADLRQPLVHLEREGVAGLRAIEGNLADAVAGLEQKVVGSGWLVHARLIPLMSFKIY